MKTAIVFFAVLNALTCNKANKMKHDFNGLLEYQQQLDVYRVKYGANTGTGAFFYEGYAVERNAQLGKSGVDKLAAILKDSANFLPDRSKNCVLAASYGFKLASDSAKYVVLIGKNPCMKVLILNETNNAETIFDLTDSNRLTPFLDSLFTK